MESRGQKRSELGELPMDKRACSRDTPGSENPIHSQAAANSVSSTLSEFHDGDMDTDHTGTSYSEGEHEDNSAYGSCDSEGSVGEGSVPARNSLATYPRSQSSDQLAKLSKVISNLSKPDADESAMLTTLTDLCEQLSFFNGYSLTSVMVDSLSSILVKLAKHETSPNIMLLAIRAITYTCDVFPRAVGFFVKHEAVPALCQRLIAIEYLDVAEQCLQALDKIARDQPLACLHSGVIMAALTYIDFFCTSIQRVALAIVLNICKKLPSDSHSSLMEALPILCNLLQYEDQQVSESVATCLIKITAQVSQSSALLDEMCKQGMINQVIRIIDMNSHTTRAALSQTVYIGLIGLLSKLACGSLMAFKTILEHNISTILRDILCSCYLSTGFPVLNARAGHYNLMQEVLKLLNELLPSIDEGQAAAIVSDRKFYLVGHPKILRSLGTDILPPLIQVINKGADMHICYGCLSFINKLVYLSKPEMLLELIQNLNISSFLAGVFTRKDPHVLILALQISETILQKQSDSFINSFIKDGVFFCIEALLKIQLSSQFMFPVIDGTNLSNEPCQMAFRQETGKCLCFALHAGHSSGSNPCKLKQDSVNNLAKQIMLNFFPEEGSDSNNGLTEIHQELKALSGKLTELLTTFRSSDEGHSELDEECQHVLSLILKKLNGSEPVSTFEFIESGIVKALLTYLSHGTHIRQDLHDDIILSYLHKVGNRFQIFAKLSMHLLDNQSGNLPVLTLVRKLQTALSTLENFPVILGQPFKLRSSIALIPDGRVTMHPTFKVHFLKGQGEQNLSDYSSDYVTVDPFTPLKSIEEHLWSKVRTRNKESVGSSTQADATIEFPSACEGVVEGNIIDHMETDCRTSAALPLMQDMDAYSEDLVSKDDQSHLPLSVQAQCFKSSSNSEGSSNLSLYLGDRKLDLGLTLYQSVLQQQMMPDYESVNSTKFWTSVYTVTYRRALNCGESSQNLYYRTGEQLYAQNSEPSWLYALIIFKMFDSKIASDLDQLGPARDVLYLLSSLECMNRNVPKLLCQERIYAYVDEEINELNSLLLHGNSVPQKEFVSSRLTEKLEQQMQDPVAVSVGGLPSWWNQLVVSCPFLFAFDARCKYFCLSAIDPLKDMSHINSLCNSRSSIDRRISSSGLPRKKFLAVRDRILESATKMMAQLAYHKGTLEVEFGDEVGTGLGPTLEFYTLVSHAFQRRGMGMWREDSLMQHSEEEIGGLLASRFGLFPRPWHCSETGSDGTLLNEVIKRFVLLGQIVAKALQDGRFLDLYLSKPFYKIILGQTLDLCDIQLFDPELGRALLKFKAISQENLVQAKMFTESSISETVPGFHTTEIENLSLDFTLPGYPDYLLHSGKNNEMVTMDNLEEYVLLIEDATLNSGICRQVEAFKAGFNQIFPIERTHIFNEEELERLLCGQQYLLAHPDELLDHVKFDHGYTASSPPILNLLEVLQGLDHDEQRAFVQFVTGTPRLPPGGLASLNPRLTIVRKHSDNFVDAELPSAMTCANYLKLPPYSSKAIMKEKLLYAISEGQGSFHLS